MHLASMKILLTLDGESSLGEGGPSPAARGGRGRQGGDGRVDGEAIRCGARPDGGVQVVRGDLGRVGRGRGGPVSSKDNRCCDPRPGARGRGGVCAGAGLAQEAAVEEAAHVGLVAGPDDEQGNVEHGDGIEQYPNTGVVEGEPFGLFVDVRCHVSGGGGGVRSLVAVSGGSGFMGGGGGFVGGGGGFVGGSGGHCVGLWCMRTVL